MTKSALHIAILAVDGVQLLDLAGPYAAFEEANSTRPNSYALSALGVDNNPVAAEGGLSINPKLDLKTRAAIDTLIIPGGGGVRNIDLDDRQLKALRACAKRARRVVGVCTGAFLIAKLGLADGKKIATHWRYADELSERHPGCLVDGKSLFVRDGNLWTSAGITAGIDLALALIREDYGAPVAASVARDLVVYLQRPGDQKQFAAPLAAQAGRTGDFAKLIEWIGANLTADLSVDALADKANMSARNFARAFRDVMGEPPARFVEKLRLDLARQILAQGAASVENVSATVGYNNPDSFRRAFERAFGVPPSFYRETFGECVV